MIVLTKFRETNFFKLGSSESCAAPTEGGYCGTHLSLFDVLFLALHYLSMTLIQTLEL